MSSLDSRCPSLLSLLPTRQFQFAVVRCSAMDALRVVRLLILFALLAPFAPTSAVNRRCPVHKFDCQNGVCISGSRWCNGYDDCGGNAADETSCPKCLSGSTMCPGETRCISPEAKCDGKPDCKDGSDESSCPVSSGSHVVPGSSTTQPETTTASPESVFPEETSASSHVPLPCRSLALSAILVSATPLAKLAFR